MNQKIKGSTNSLTCNVCKVDFSSNADYALHEFSKKHCNNLIRLARPVGNKQKSRNKNSEEKKESSKISTAIQTESFAKYGYFIPGEICKNAETSKGISTDCDPYLQKFAENSFKEKPVNSAPPETATFCAVTSFSKKKKKKIKKCQICNVTLSTIPEYKAHMKSLQHIWKLKITGMGVSAHFIKASTNLQATNINEESMPNIQTSNEQTSSNITTSNKDIVSGPFPLLYCSDCELLFNSVQQYNVHISGKFHTDCAQKKTELRAKKNKLENPSPNQLYCYSCKISLNNLLQYNEHKNGKKHKTKCLNLIKKGITIPPEERVPGIPLPNPKIPTVYPELYEKFILEKQKLKPAHFLSVNDLNASGFSVGLNHPTENNWRITGSSTGPEDKKINSNFPAKSTDRLETQNGNKSTVTAPENHVSSFTAPKVIFQKNDTNTLLSLPVINNDNLTVDVINSQMNVSNYQINSSSDSIKLSENEPKDEIKILIDSEPIKCSICCEFFQSQHQLDVHVGTEVHLCKILELKMKGVSEREIISAIFSDRNVIKPSTTGKLTCSVCTITLDSKVEFDGHINSVFHKYTLKDYKMKRTVEVKNIISSNEQGLYFCKLCIEGWPSLLEYIQHLHSVKHRTTQRAQRAKIILAKRKISNLQKQRLKVLKKKNALRRTDTEKNLGKGATVDLQIGIQVSDLIQEPLESKIGFTKNLSGGSYKKTNDSIGSSCNNNNNNNQNHPNDEKLKETEIKKLQRPNRKIQNRGPYPNNTPPFMPPRSFLPPLLPFSSHHLRFSRPSYDPTNRNWTPYSYLNSQVSKPFFGRFRGNPYVRPPRCQRLPWPRYR